MAQEQAVDLKQVTRSSSRSGRRVISPGSASRGRSWRRTSPRRRTCARGSASSDVACGAGNGAIAAARRTWDATVGLDYVPALLERGRERAAAERLEVEFVQGDAQELPFEDESFDVVMSIFGAMFAPDHQSTADERCGSPRAVVGSRWRTGLPPASSGRCSGRSPAMRRLRRASHHRRSGAPRSTCRRCSATGSRA